MATDSWHGADSQQVGAALGRAWRALDDEVAVLPMGTAGGGFRRALSELPEGRGVDVLAPRLPRPARPEDRWEEGSEVLAPDLTCASGRGPLLLELADAPWRDGGRGLARRLGITGLGGGAESKGRRLDLVTTAEQAARPLTGLRGVVSVEARQQGMDPARMLSLDQALCDWAAELTGDPASGETPGSGAAGGLGLLVSAIGGTVTTGPQILMDLAGARATMAAADLVVTGCDHLDFATLAGEVIAGVIAAASPLGVPVIAVPRSTEVSARELRQAGLEAALPLDREEIAGPWSLEQITRAARPIARTWHW